MLIKNFVTLQELEKTSTDWAEIWMKVAEKSSRYLTHLFGLEKWETSQNIYKGDIGIQFCLIFIFAEYTMARIK